MDSTLVAATGRVVDFVQSLAGPHVCPCLMRFVILYRKTTCSSLARRKKGGQKLEFCTDLFAPKCVQYCSKIVTPHAYNDGRRGCLERLAVA